MKSRDLKTTGFYVDFIKKIFIGLLIGISSVTPGLSGGVVAAAIGLYEPVVHAIVTIKKESRKNLVFLLPLAIGTAIGVFLFSKAMQKLMAVAEFMVLYVFLGLVAGSLPALVKEANSGGFRKRYLWVLAAAFFVVAYIGKIIGRVPNPAARMEMSSIHSLLYGMVLAVGTIIPGISSSFILMYLGAYQSLLAAVTNLNFRVLIILAVGFAITALVMLKLVDFVFRRFRGFAYYAVTGFLLGSMFLIFPGLRTGRDLAVDLILFSAGLAVSLVTLSFNKKRSP